MNNFEVSRYEGKVGWWPIVNEPRSLWVWVGDDVCKIIPTGIHAKQVKTKQKTTQSAENALYRYERMGITERKCWARMQIRRKKTIRYVQWEIKNNNKQKRGLGLLYTCEPLSAFCWSLTLFVSNRFFVFSHFCFCFPSVPLWERAGKFSGFDAPSFGFLGRLSLRFFFHWRKYETFYCVETKSKQPEIHDSISHFFFPDYVKFDDVCHLRCTAYI